jgi:hypothetical protein
MIKQLSYSLNWFLFIFLLFYTSSLIGQCEEDLCRIDSLVNATCCKKVYILGEAHRRDETTSFYQINLTKKIIQKGARNAIICLEIPPSVVYFIKKYFETSDTNYLFAFYYNDDLHRYIRWLFEYKDSISIDFIGYEVEGRNSFKAFLDFKSQIIDSNVVGTNNIIEELLFSKRKKKIKCIANKLINDTALWDSSSVYFKKDYHSLIFESLLSISKFGFMKKRGSDKNMIIRDKHIARVIEQNYNSKSVLVCTIGRAHITPIKDNLLPDLIQNMEKLERSDFVLLPILYQDIYWIYYNKVWYNNKDFYKIKMPFELLEQMGIFDLILNTGLDR